jgi:4-carboxymuconolactone decarboxylase
MATTGTPGTYRQLKQQHGTYMAAVEALGSAVRGAGPLDDKIMQLVQLGAAAAIRSEGAVHSHVRRARALGVSALEIRHALISLTSTIGFPTVSAALSWADDVIKGPRVRPKSAPRKGAEKR